MCIHPSFRKNCVSWWLGLVFQPFSKANILQRHVSMSVTNIVWHIYRRYLGYKLKRKPNKNHDIMVSENEDWCRQVS
jgi:NAD-dependent SIR2 family protein deacetylase